MKAKFGFIDPGAIMGVVVALVVLAVGTYAFFYTMSSVQNQLANSNDNTAAKASINNTTQTGNNVFNIIGVVMIIGAIMSIVGLVYNYVR